MIEAAFRGALSDGLRVTTRVLGTGWAPSALPCPRTGRGRSLRERAPDEPVVPERVDHASLAQPVWLGSHGKHFARSGGGDGLLRVLG